MSSTWLTSYAGQSPPRLRLVVLPHAGGSPPTFRPWRPYLPPEVELLVASLPGRSFRLREPAVRDHATLLRGLSDALRPQLDLPYVLFGHSFGARVGLALAHQLRREGARAPQALVVSGRRGPRIPPIGPPLHALPKAAFIDAVERRYGVLNAALRHPELADLVVPPLRADLQLLETWPDELGPPLSAPIYARGGAEDPCASQPDLEAWRQETTGAFELQLLPGAHFYLLQDPKPLLDSLRPILR